MNKTAISILQEYLVQRRKPLPLYTDEHSDLPDHAFKCTVSFENIRETAYANSKKEAKQKSAQLALLRLGVSTKAYQEFTTTTTEPPLKNALCYGPTPTAEYIHSAPTPSNKCIPNENYVGKLNERASTNAKPYPVYDESAPAFNGNFCIKCRFLEWDTVGYGTNKKSAKQDAARNMLEILKEKGISRTMPELKTEKVDNINKLCEEMIKKYKELTKEEKYVPTSQTFPTIPNLKTEVSSLEELQSTLRKNGHPNSIEVFQRNPFVMILKLQGSCCRVMGHGETKQEACEDLLKSSKIMFNSGFSFVNGWST